MLAAAGLDLLGGRVMEEVLVLLECYNRMTL